MWRAGEARCDGLFHIAQTHRANIALDLGQDMGWLQAFENVVEYFVDRQRTARGVLDLLIDGAAVGVHVDQRFRAGWQVADRRRVVAFMRTADQQIFDAPERQPFRLRWKSEKRFCASRKLRHITYKGMELAVFAAGIDPGGQFSEKSIIERPADRRRGQFSLVDSTNSGAQAAADHVPRESIGWFQPEWKDGSHSRGRKATARARRVCRRGIDRRTRLCRFLRSVPVPKQIAAARHIRCWNTAAAAEPSRVEFPAPRIARRSGVAARCGSEQCSPIPKPCKEVQRFRIRPESGAETTRRLCHLTRKRLLSSSVYSYGGTHSAAAQQLVNSEQSAGEQQVARQGASPERQCKGVAAE